MNLYQKTQPTVLGIIFLGLLSAFEVHAERICVHGHSGELQDPEVRHKKYAWGLRVYPRHLWEDGSNERQGDWVHYSIPVDTERSYNRIRIKVGSSATNGNDRVWIDEAHIWMGNHRVKVEKDLTSWILDPMYLDIDLDSSITFWNSIGVSLKLTKLDFPVGTYRNQSIDIASVCAFE